MSGLKVLNPERESQVSGFHLTNLSNRTYISVKDLVFPSRGKFDNKPGAVLLMHRPRRTYIPDEFFEASRGVSILEGKFVVTETWESPGDFWYLSSKSRCSVS